MINQTKKSDHEIMDTINHYLQKNNVPFKMTVFKSPTTSVKTYSIHKMENGKPVKEMVYSLDPTTTFELFVGGHREEQWYLDIWKAYKQFLGKEPEQLENTRELCTDYF